MGYVTRIDCKSHCLKMNGEHNMIEDKFEIVKSHHTTDGTDLICDYILRYKGERSQDQNENLIKVGKLILAKRERFLLKGGCSTHIGTTMDNVDIIAELDGFEPQTLDLTKINLIHLCNN